jgi:hypothetical protein
MFVGIDGGCSPSATRWAVPGGITRRTCSGDLVSIPGITRKAISDSKAPKINPATAKTSERFTIGFRNINILSTTIKHHWLSIHFIHISLISD